MIKSRIQWHVVNSLTVVCRSGHLITLFQHQQTPFELSKLTCRIRRKYVPWLCYVHFNYSTQHCFLLHIISSLALKNKAQMTRPTVDDVRKITFCVSGDVEGE